MEKTHIAFEFPRISEIYAEKIISQFVSSFLSICLWRFLVSNQKAVRAICTTFSWFIDPQVDACLCFFGVHGARGTCCKAMPPPPKKKNEFCAVCRPDDAAQKQQTL